MNHFVSLFLIIKSPLPLLLYYSFATRYCCVFFLFVLSANVGAEAIISVNSTYYQFSANDKASIWKGIRDSSPKVSMDDHTDHRVVVGLTEWQLRYRYRFRSVPYHCEIKSFSINLDISIHLPFWVDKWKAPVELQQSWDRYVRMVSTHENIHKSYALRTVNLIDKDVSELKPVKRCDDLKAQVEGIAKRHVQQNKMDNRWFDAKEKIYQKNAIWF